MPKKRTSRKTTHKRKRTRRLKRRGGGKYSLTDSEKKLFTKISYSYFTKSFDKSDLKKIIHVAESSDTNKKIIILRDFIEDFYKMKNYPKSYANAEQEMYRLVKNHIKEFKRWIKIYNLRELNPKKKIRSSVKKLKHKISNAKNKKYKQYCPECEKYHYYDYDSESLSKD